MLRLKFALLAGLAIATPLPAVAAGPGPNGAIYSTISVASDYRYQGVSNSDGNPALQANIHWWRPDNFYAGVFATEVDFRDPGHTSYELDVYAGKHVDLNHKKTRLTADVMYTAFPDKKVPGPTYNFWQFKAAAKHTEGKASVAAITSYVPEASYGSGQAWRVEGEATYTLTPSLTLKAAAGRRWIERGYDRNYWSAGATATWKTLSFDVRYVDTNLKADRCNYLRTDACDPAVVGTLTVVLPLIY